MSSAGLYAVATFAAGLMLLLGWLYVTTDNPRSNRMLFKSTALYLPPGAVLIALPDNWIQFPLSLWLLVLAEEGIKAVSAATEGRGLNRFALVVLFGIWELMIAKPVWGIENSEVLAGWTRLQLAGLTVAGMVTVLMHAVTAQIYAFRFEGRLVPALAASCVLHIAFNESINLLGVSLLASVLQLLVLGLLFGALWPKGSAPAPVQSSSSS